MCSTAAHQPSEVVRLCRSTYASRYRAVELNTLSRRNRTPHALLARGAEGLKRSCAAYLVPYRAIVTGGQPQAGHLAESECSSRVCCPMSSHSHARRALLFLWPAAALSLAARGGAHVPDRCPPPPACQCRGTRSRGRRHERAHRRGRHAPRAQVIFAKKSLRRVTASLLQHAAIDGL